MVEVVPVMVTLQMEQAVVVMDIIHHLNGAHYTGGGGSGYPFSPGENGAGGNGIVITVLIPP